MCLRATICSPLRSKRAMISPVRPRANASGLTRIRVRSTMQFLSVLASSSLRATSRQAARERVTRRSSCATSAATVGWSVVDDRPRRRRVACGGGSACTSASQYGHSFHAGSTGLPHE